MYTITNQHLCLSQWIFYVSNNFCFCIYVNCAPSYGHQNLVFYKFIPSLITTFKLLAICIKYIHLSSTYLRQLLTVVHFLVIHCSEHDGNLPNTDIPTPLQYTEPTRESLRYLYGFCLVTIKGLLIVKPENHSQTVQFFPDLTTRKHAL